MYKIIGNDLIEGICPGNCCGGMKLYGCDNDRDDLCKGDYKFTDTSPPPKWKRCFKPRLINGKVDGYDWDTSPCSEKNGEKCCGGVGKCVRSEYGGYCRATKNFTEKDKDNKVIGNFKSGDGFIYDVTNGYRIKHDRNLHDLSKNSNGNSNNFFNDVERKKRICKEGEEETINLSDDEIVKLNEEDEEAELILITVSVIIFVILSSLGFVVYKYKGSKLSKINAPVRGADTFLKPGAPNVKRPKIKGRYWELIIAILVIIIFIVLGIIIYFYEEDKEPTEEEQRRQQSM